MAKIRTCRQKIQRSLPSRRGAEFIRSPNVSIRRGRVLYQEAWPNKFGPTKDTLPHRKRQLVRCSGRFRIAESDFRNDSGCGKEKVNETLSFRP